MTVFRHDPWNPDCCDNCRDYAKVSRQTTGIVAYLIAIVLGIVVWASW